MPHSRVTIVIAVILAGCVRASEPSVAAVAGQTELTTRSHSYVFSRPLPAAGNENGVCFQFTNAARLLDDWSVSPTPDAPGVYPRAEARLADGRRVPLTNKVWSEGYCLQPARQGALGAPVSELRVWSSAPVRVQRISWYSTHK